MEPSLVAAAPDTLGPALETLASPVLPSMGRMMLGLVVVLAIIGGIVLLLRRFGAGSTSLTRGNEIRVLSRTPVGRRSTIVLVEVDQRRILVGATPTQLTPLSEWEREPDPELSVTEARAPSAERFGSVLDRVVGKLEAMETPR